MPKLVRYCRLWGLTFIYALWLDMISFQVEKLKAYPVYVLGHLNEWIVTMLPGIYFNVLQFLIFKSASLLETPDGQFHQDAELYDGRDFSGTFDLSCYLPRCHSLRNLGFAEHGRVRMLHYA